MVFSPTAPLSTTPTPNSSPSSPLEIQWGALLRSCYSLKLSSALYPFPVSTSSHPNARVNPSKVQKMSFVRNFGQPFRQIWKCGHCCNSSTSQLCLLSFKFSTSISCKFGGTPTSVLWNSATKILWWLRHQLSLLSRWVPLSVKLRPILQKYEFFPVFLWSIERVSRYSGSNL